MRGALVGVGVEAVEADVEDARAEALGDQAGDELQLLRRDRRPAAARRSGPSSSSRRVSTAVRVCTCRRCTNDARSSSAAWLGGAARSSSSLRRAFCCATLPPPSSRRNEFWSLTRDRAAARRPGQGQRQAVRGRGAGWARRPHGCRSRPRHGPASRSGSLGLGRLPDVHGLEVRTLRVRVADALHDRQLSFLPHRPEAPHAGVEADVVVQADDHVLGLAQRGPGLVVQVVGVGNDGVEAVIAAGHLEHDQDVVLARRGGLRGPGHELRDHRAQRHQRRALQASGSETADG